MTAPDRESVRECSLGDRVRKLAHAHRSRGSIPRSTPAASRGRRTASCCSSAYGATLTTPRRLRDARGFCQVRDPGLAASLPPR